MEKKFVGKKKTYQTIQIITACFRARILAASVPELRAIVKMCKGFTSTNFGWDCYWMRDVIIRFAQDELGQRKRERKENRKKVTP